MFNVFDAFMTVVVIVASTVVTYFLVRRAPSVERPYLFAAFGMHILFALALRFSQGNVFQEGDLTFYRDASAPFVEAMNRDFFHWAPQLVRVTFRLPNEMGVDDFSSTMSMITVTALLRFFTLDSFWALYCVLAFFSFLGKWGLYVAVREEAKDVGRGALLVASMCLPSAVFWTSGLVKEAFAVIGLCALVYAVHIMLAGRVGRGIPLALLGSTLVGVFKPPFLFPFAFGLGAWIFFHRSQKSRRLAPLYLAVGVVIGYGLVALLSVLFPEFSPNHIAEQVAEAQLYGERTGAEHTYAVGDYNTRTLTGQLAYAPLALVTTLARPALWETHNVSSTMASLEMTVLSALLLFGIVRGGIRGLRAMLDAPIVVFAVTFALLAAVAVGLATTNFGTLSRYRVPILPFYGVVVAVLASRSKRPASKPGAVPVQPRLPLRGVRRAPALGQRQSS